MAAASDTSSHAGVARRRVSVKREREPSEPAIIEGKEEESDPLIAAALQNNQPRFVQLWDQLVARLVAQKAAVQEEVGRHFTDEEGEAWFLTWKRVLLVESTVRAASNVAMLSVLAATVVPRHGNNILASFTLLDAGDIKQAIQDDDIELVRFAYTAVLPAATATHVPLFSIVLPLGDMDSQVDRFLSLAHSEAMCALGQQLFGALLKSPRSFELLFPLYGGELPSLQTAQHWLAYSTPWWVSQRRLVGPGVPIAAPGFSIAASGTIGKLLSRRMRDDAMETDFFQMYKLFTSSELWRVAEFHNPKAATAQLTTLLAQSQGASQYTGDAAATIQQFATYLIETQDADWTTAFVDEAHTIAVLREDRDKLLAVLFDALSVRYVARLLLDAWDSVYAQRLLALAELLASQPFLPERAAVLQLEQAFPHNVAFGEGNRSLLNTVHGAVRTLSRVYRRVALLLRDVTDVTQRVGGPANTGPSFLSEDKRQHLKQLSTRLLARVTAAEPERLLETQSVLETVGGFPTELATFTSLLGYQRQPVGSQAPRRRQSFTPKGQS